MKLLIFGADYCGACNRMNNEVVPVLQTEGVEVEYVDGMRQPQRAKNWNIRKIPYIICFNEQEQVLWQHEGYLSFEEIQSRC